MQEYHSAHALREDAEQQAKQAARRRTRKLTLVGIVAAVAIIPTAAYAVITGITGSGTVKSEDGAEKVALVISESDKAPALYPGKSADISFKVSNANPYAVKLSQITAGKLVSKCDVTLFSSPLPTNGTPYTFPGFSDTSLTIPAKVGNVAGTKVITIKKGLKLSSKATTSCAYSLPITISGDQAS